MTRYRVRAAPELGDFPSATLAVIEALTLGISPEWDAVDGALEEPAGSQPGFARDSWISAQNFPTADGEMRPAALRHLSALAPEPPQRFFKKSLENHLTFLRSGAIVSFTEGDPAPDDREGDPR